MSLSSEHGLSSAHAKKKFGIAGRQELFLAVVLRQSLINLYFQWHRKRDLTLLTDVC
jgi:hypothetical protein